MLDVGVLYHYSPRLIRVAGWPLSRALPCHINAKAHRASGRELLRPRSCSRLCCSHRCRSSSASVTFCLQLASATPTSSSSSHWPRTRRRTSLWTTPTRRTSCTCGGTTCWEARGQGQEQREKNRQENRKNHPAVTARRGRGWRRRGPKNPEEND